MIASQLADLKRDARATWAAGDYPAIARRDLWPVGDRVVRHAGVASGDDVLDVGCGTGNAALRAAQAGARVTGLDLTPELLEVGRGLAADAGVEIDWVEGDAEALPFPDGSFDVVVSTFGCMFAPRHEVAAREIARVLRPGGRLAITAWTPDGSMGSFFGTVGAYLPPPPQAGPPPAAWGSEEHVRSLFAGTGLEPQFKRELLEWSRHSGVDEEIEFLTRSFGPLIHAREVTEADGRWPELRGDLAQFFERNEAGEYLLTLGRRTG